jgi:phage-related baseplate assembly protein
MPVIVPTTNIAPATGTPQVVPVQLPNPTFVNDADGLSATLILADMVAQFEANSGRVLYPAQLEQLLINLYAYRETIVRNAIQYCGMQNLLAFAVYPMLDYLGEFFDVQRFPQQPAITTLLVTLSAQQTTSTDIPQGTLVGTSDGVFQFSTTLDLVIPAGAVLGYVVAQCTTYGDAANGYTPGGINQIVSAVPGSVQSIVNTTTSMNGSGVETDSHYRTRIQAAPNNLSTAGPSGSYRSLALDVSPTVTDAQVVSPVPGTVNVYILSGPVTIPRAYPNNTGNPTSQLVLAIQAALSAGSVRPLCDTVNVFAATEVDYQIGGVITLFGNTDYVSVTAGIQAAAQQLALQLASNIQTDVIYNEWVNALFIAGVYNLQLTITANVGGGAALTPTADGSFILGIGQWANLSSFSPTIVFGSRLQPVS